MFDGPIWGAWLGLFLMIIGYLLTLPTEGGKLTFRFLGGTASVFAFFLLCSQTLFPHQLWIFSALVSLFLACAFFSIFEARIYGFASSIGEFLLGYGTYLVFESLYAALATIIVLVIVFLIRRR